MIIKQQIKALVDPLINLYSNNINTLSTVSITQNKLLQLLQNSAVCLDQMSTLFENQCMYSFYDQNKNKNKNQNMNNIVDINKNTHFLFNYNNSNIIKDKSNINYQSNGSSNSNLQKTATSTFKKYNKISHDNLQINYFQTSKCSNIVSQILNLSQVMINNICRWIQANFIRAKQNENEQNKNNSHNLYYSKDNVSNVHCINCQTIKENIKIKAIKEELLFNETRGLSFKLNENQKQSFNQEESQNFLNPSFWNCLQTSTYDRQKHLLYPKADSYLTQWLTQQKLKQNKYFQIKAQIEQSLQQQSKMDEYMADQLIDSLLNLFKKHIGKKQITWKIKKFATILNNIQNDSKKVAQIENAINKNQVLCTCKCSIHGADGKNKDKQKQKDQSRQKQKQQKNKYSINSISGAVVSLTAKPKSRSKPRQFNTVSLPNDTNNTNTNKEVQIRADPLQQKNQEQQSDDEDSSQNNEIITQNNKKKKKRKQIIRSSNRSKTGVLVSGNKKNKRSSISKNNLSTGSNMINASNTNPVLNLNLRKQKKKQSSAKSQNLKQNDVTGHQDKQKQQIMQFNQQQTKIPSASNNSTSKKQLGIQCNIWGTLQDVSEYNNKINKHKFRTSRISEVMRQVNSIQQFMNVQEEQQDKQSSINENTVDNDQIIKFKENNKTKASSSLTKLRKQSELLNQANIISRKVRRNQSMSLPHNSRFSLLLKEGMNLQCKQQQDATNRQKHQLPSLISINKQNERGKNNKKNSQSQIQQSKIYKNYEQNRVKKQMSQKSFNVSSHKIIKNENIIKRAFIKPRYRNILTQGNAGNSSMAENGIKFAQQVQEAVKKKNYQKIMKQKQKQHRQKNKKIFISDLSKITNKKIQQSMFSIVDLELFGGMSQSWNRKKNYYSTLLTKHTKYQNGQPQTLISKLIDHIRALSSYQTGIFQIVVSFLCNPYETVANKSLIKTETGYQELHKIIKGIYDIHFQNCKSYSCDHIKHFYAKIMFDFQQREDTNKNTCNIIKQSSNSQKVQLVSQKIIVQQK